MEELVSRVQRRRRVARDFLADARLLAESTAKRSDADYLLKLLGFELLLKTVSLIHEGKTSGHRYSDIFRSLPEDVREGILHDAGGQMATAADYSDVSSVLASLSKNFVQLRYPFEEYDALSDDEYRERGEAWIEDGAHEATADFVYYPEELAGLIHALQEHVEWWLESSKD